MTEPFHLLYTASREVDDVTRGFRHLDGVLERHGSVHLVHGDYKRRDGRLVSDAIAQAWATQRIAEGCPVTVEPIAAPWELLGAVAGPYRNGFMAGLLVGRGVQPVGCVAYIVEGSRGASGCAAFAEHVGIPVRRYEGSSGDSR
ncbi:hypothetical protein ABGB18_11060 [Nonomuraea sp. B12E4]|uniref:hypothetical protein n=1 Tax=Nonomuraea sp. B12E4 TaxID=3153564 RepID=UPI00325C8DD8